jgi:hypothetical protein
VGVDGFFLEVHPDPVTALSDGPNMVPWLKWNSWSKICFQSGWLHIICLKQPKTFFALSFRMSIGKWPKY